MSAISERYSTTQESPQNKKQTFFDTFDWRLYNEGLILVKEANSYHLSTLKQDRTLATSNWKSKTQPKFWWDLPDGFLRSKLQSYLSVRALLPLANVKNQAQTLRVLNEDQKTVLRVHLEKMELMNGRQTSRSLNCLRLQPVRGYDDEFHSFDQFLQELGVNQEARETLLIALQAVGKEPGEYSSKLNIQLTPEMTGRAAAQRILNFLLNVIKQNEWGIQADIDTEFLHDFRVAIRRTRSALSQIKGVYPKDVTKRFRQDFKSLGKLTNRLRDLDVHLLKKSEYQDMLPESLRPGLEPIFQNLQEERKREHRKFVRAINAESYKKTLRSWEGFLNAEQGSDLAESKNSQTPAIDLARKFIRKEYGKVMSQGQAITDDSPDPELHSLRIQCKKLRYLMEFFSSLFPEKEIARLIKQLKKLQDNLGDYNDLYVQQESLKEFLGKVDVKSADYAHVNAAIGGLIAILYQKQQQVRRAFSQTFSAFSKKKNNDSFQKLFG
ncbi:CHAD domain-containing protein [candidate division KSB1 bacterium]|nr:CHAD domain-containing protein [candidate division KSB1 bacterium]NIR70928.1 CHAD domain-containing protein [candidate division KSB1 bacterium]NIS24680.1 CHAD domain-containing protein [candidate division KSB1 bacterium]NIT71582.1 CHAD domain-containing protein [candidate division KSB1 bacterium]NIU25280.1 CHAD domain-containing protein [candidate division KSB1 bacterium]